MIKKYLAWVRDLTHKVCGPSVDPGSLQIDACWLDDRLLYSATMLPIEMIDGEALGSGMEVSQAEIDAIMECINAELGGQSDTLGESGLTTDSTASQALPTLASESSMSALSSSDANNANTSVLSVSDSTAARMEVAFVDGSLDNLEDLLEQLQASYAGDEGSLQVVLLDRHSSGFEQITNYLANTDQDFSSMHLVTHGSGGQIQLGSDWLNIDTFDQYSSQMQLWQDSLTDDADLLIYGCGVASTLDGQTLGMELAQLLDADVALSNDLTGAAALGGDWDLEFQTGLIETQSRVSYYAANEWQGLLATYTVTNTNDSGAGSLRQAITDAITMRAPIRSSSPSGAALSPSVSARHCPRSPGRRFSMDGPSQAIRRRPSLSSTVMEYWATAWF